MERSVVLPSDTVETGVGFIKPSLLLSQTQFLPPPVPEEDGRKNAVTATATSRQLLALDDITGTVSRGSEDNGKSMKKWGMERADESPLPNTTIVPASTNRRWNPFSVSAQADTIKDSIDDNTKVLSQSVSLPVSNLTDSSRTESQISASADKPIQTEPVAVAVARHTTMSTEQKQELIRKLRGTY